MTGSYEKNELEARLQKKIAKYKHTIEKMRILINASPDLICFKDAKGCWIEANEAALRFLGIEGIDFQGKKDSELAEISSLYRESFLTCKSTDESAWKKKTLSRGDEEITQPDGTMKTLDMIKVPLFHPDGSRKGMVILGRDISQRRQAEQEYRIEQLYFKDLFESLPQAVVLLNNQDSILRANREFIKLFGYSWEELRNTDVKKLIVPENLLQEAESFKKQTAEVRRVLSETVRQCKDGTLVHVSILAEPILLEKGQIAICVIYNDITERKKTEEELIKLSSAVEQSPAIVAITDIKGNLEYVNPKFSRLTGYTLEEVIGKNPRILQSGETPEDDYKRLWAATSKGLEWRGTFCNKKKNGELYWEEAAISPIRDNKGKITHYLKVAEDITERKKLEDQLVQAQKLEAVGRLAGGVAHDFNNLLTVISGYSELVLAGLSQQDPLRKDVYEIKKAGERAALLTEQLLAFSRKKLLQPKVFDLNRVIKHLLKMVKRLIGEDIEIITFLDNDLVRIKADPGQIEQVIVNIAVNARDAMPEGGKLTIETANVYLDKSFVILHPELKQGLYITLSVSDTGTGMDRETLDHIFDPFYTTKEQGKGTGLGLSMAYGIITQSGGAILTESKPGQGTVFKIYLPGLAESKSLTQQEEKKAISFAKGTELILLVEDEDAVRRLTATLLIKHGYSVIEAINGEEALKIIKESRCRVDMLITDVVMPKMSGNEVAEKMRAISPELKVLFISGYTDNVIGGHKILEEGADFLAKPYSSEQLLTRVRRIFDE
jgi:PAS domain S-box-containing protein